jgi:hypothetical protein
MKKYSQRFVLSYEYKMYLLFHLSDKERMKMVTYIKILIYM